MIRPVVTGGDVAVILKDNKAAQALLASWPPGRGEIWAKLGGYLSPNKNVTPSAYPTR